MDDLSDFFVTSFDKPIKVDKSFLDSISYTGFEYKKICENLKELLEKVPSAKESIKKMIVFTVLRGTKIEKALKKTPEEGANSIRTMMSELNMKNTPITGTTLTPARLIAIVPWLAVECAVSYENPIFKPSSLGSDFKDFPAQLCNPYFASFLMSKIDNLDSIFNIFNAKFTMLIDSTVKTTSEAIKKQNRFLLAAKTSKIMSSSTKIKWLEAWKIIYVIRDGKDGKEGKIVKIGLLDTVKRFLPIAEKVSNGTYDYPGCMF